MTTLYLFNKLYVNNINNTKIKSIILESAWLGGGGIFCGGGGVKLDIGV